MATPIGDLLVNGKPTAPEDASISVFDIGFQRGYGCFEAMRVYQGRIFRLREHVARLGSSAAMLHLPLPPPDTIEEWCRSVATGDSALRILVSGGIDARNIGTDSKVVVLCETLDPQPQAYALQTRIAPWHSDGTIFELTGAKALSYGFNLAATTAARIGGFDDALLVGESGWVLEGPNYTIGWVAGGRLFTPSLDLGILGSITRSAVVDAAPAAQVEVVEGRFGVDALYAADEVLLMSSVREVLPVGRVDDHAYRPGPVTERVRRAFRDLVRAELGL